MYASGVEKRILCEAGEKCKQQKCPCGGFERQEQNEIDQHRRINVAKEIEIIENHDLKEHDHNEADNMFNDKPTHCTPVLHPVIARALL